VQKSWTHKAALYEILTLAFLYPGDSLIESLISGEYGEALHEILELNKIENSECEVAVQGLSVYVNGQYRELAHILRTEYTRLFIGSPKPTVSPFAGIWYAEERGIDPLLFINGESMAIERFMRSNGVGHPTGTNEPLDHIASQLEFLQYLCLVQGGAVSVSDGIKISPYAYEQFLTEHFSSFAKHFAEKTWAEADEALYRTAAAVLAAIS
jgi:TorA maturation chaperone TorD